MATAYNIKHPSYVEEESENKNYLLFGVVNKFCYLEGDRSNVAEKLEFQWTVVGGCQDWDIAPTHNRDLMVVLKANDFFGRNE